jgi:hypothetical protein
MLQMQEGKDHKRTDRAEGNSLNDTGHFKGYCEGQGGRIEP